MKSNPFKTLLILDGLQLLRNRIAVVALVVALIYSAIFQILPANGFNYILITLVFTDPAMLGFMFIGVMVLLEKSGNTLQAMGVTPVSAAQYLWSKAIVLTAVALLASTIMAIAGKGLLAVQWHWYIVAVVFTSILFVFVGFVGATMVRTVNQYFLIIPLFMIPASLPFLNFYGITNTHFWYIIPSQASLILMDAAFNENTSVSIIQIVYALIWLPLSCLLALKWAALRWQKATGS